MTGDEQLAIASSQPTTALPVPQGAVRCSGSARPRSPMWPPPPPPRRTTTTPPTLAQVEEGCPHTSSETEEQRRDAKNRKNIDAGGISAVSGFVVLLGLLCLPKEAKHPNNTRFIVSLLLAFGTFLTGFATIFLGMTMLGLPERLISGGQRVVARCLFFVCAALSVMTLVSLLPALVPGRLYLYIGLPVFTAFALLAGGVHWYLSLTTVGGDEAEAAAKAAYEALKGKLEAASKTTTSVTTSAFGALIGVLLSVSKSSAGVTRSVYVAMFSMLTTAMFGIFVMTVPAKVAEVKDPQLQQRLVRATWLANAFLLFSLACAALASAFAVLGRFVFAAFAPFAVTAFIRLALNYCTAYSAGSGSHEDQDAQVKAIEEAMSKVMATTVAAIMTILGLYIGEKEHEKMGATDAVVVILASAFVSSFVFMILPAVSAGSARTRLTSAAKVHFWSSMAMFATTPVVVYGMQSWGP